MTRHDTAVGLNEGQREFLTKELEARRSAIERLSDAIDRDAQVAVVACAAFWSWFASHSVDMRGTGVAFLILWLPLLLTLALSIRWWLIQSWIRRQAQYVFEVERRMQLPEGLGWEHFLNPSLSPDATPARSSEMSRIPKFAYLHVMFWLTLVALNFVLGASAFSAPQRDRAVSVTDCFAPRHCALAVWPERTSGYRRRELGPV